MWAMTCGKCQESSPADWWLESPTGEKHPEDYRQCPICRISIKIIREPAIVFVAGNGSKMLLPGKISIMKNVHIPHFDTVKLK